MQIQIEGFLMEQYLTLTVITDDRPGIVEKIAKVVLLNQGSWLESNMSRLAGKFAGVLLVKTSQNNQANLLRDLKELSNEGIKIIAELTNNLNHEPDKRYFLNLVGNDRPGIIGELSSILTGLDINVEELRTDCEDAPMSSELLFRASAVISFSGASKVTSALIQEKMELLSDDLIIELELLEE